MTYRPPPLRELLALAYIEELAQRAAQEDARRPADTVRLDTPDRAQFVPLTRRRG